MGRRMKKKITMREFRNMKMKVTIHDEFGRKIFKSEGEPKRCIRESLVFTGQGLSVFSWDEFLTKMDFLGLGPEFRRARMRKSIT